MPVRFHPSLEHLLEPLDRVSPYPGNPRQGDTVAIVESLRANGMYQPVVAQRSTGYVLAGNHRWKALHELGSDRVPVVWVDVDDAQAKRIALVDNRTSDLAVYDNTALLDLLQSLGDDLTGSGYVREDLDDLAMLLAEPEDLDDLARRLGPAPADDDWVTITVRVPPAVGDRWRAVVDASGGDGATVLAGLLS